MSIWQHKLNAKKKRKFEKKYLNGEIVRDIYGSYGKNHEFYLITRGENIKDWEEINIQEILKGE